MTLQELWDMVQNKEVIIRLCYVEGDAQVDAPVVNVVKDGSFLELWATKE